MVEANHWIRRGWQLLFLSKTRISILNVQDQGKTQANLPLPCKPMIRFYCSSWIKIAVILSGPPPLFAASTRRWQAVWGLGDEITSR
jgi:hypothetical protein